MRFTWNPAKAASNLVKHGVAFEEAVTVFDDPLFIMLLDDEHSLDEERYITIGMSDHGRPLIVAHTDPEGLIRVISARKAVPREQRFYEDGL
jgi:uncharacterized DUF497 family protein